MKRLLIVAFVLVLIAVVGLFVWKQSGSPKPGKESVMKQETQGMPKQAESTVIDSIKDAMGLGKAMQCTYMADGQASFKSSVIVNGDKFKSVTEVAGKKMYGLFDGEAQYVWTEGESKGFKMSKGCLDELKANLPAGSDTNTGAGVKDLSEGFDMAKNVTCEAAPSASADLSVPTDVMFADQCEMMRQSLEMMKNVQKQMPEGTKFPGTMPQPY